MNAVETWRSPPSRIEASPETVDVWRVRLNVAPPEIAFCQSLLSAAERKRMRRYRAARKRRELAVTRGRLRQLLGAALNVDPRELEFAEGEHGKPHLAGRARGLATFNVSHSGDVGLIAVSRSREIGVDVEQVRTQIEYSKIARRFFSPAEVETLIGLCDADREASFFRCWARKEAVIKGIGRGIGIGLSTFDVSLAPGAPPAVIETRFDPSAAARWTLVDLRVEPGYAAALAVEGTGFRVRGWDCR